MAVRKNYEPWDMLVELIEKHLRTNSVDLKNTKFRLGPALEFNTARQEFVGDGAEAANRYLRREYRSHFEVPLIS